MRWVGIYALSVEPGARIDWRRRAASTASVETPVQLSAGIVAVWTVNGRAVTVNGKVFGGFTRPAGVLLGVRGCVLPWSVDGKAVGFGVPAVGEVPAVGHGVVVRDRGLRFDGVVRDWAWRVVEGVVVALVWTCMDRTFNLLDKVDTRSGAGARFAQGTGEHAAGDVVDGAVAAVGLSAEGMAAADAAVMVSPEARAGERWQAVLRRVVGGGWWTMRGRVVSFRAPSEVWEARQFSRVAIRPLRDARALTLGVHEGAVLGVAGVGRPQESADVATLAELARVHAAGSSGAVHVTAESELPSVVPRVGARITVVVPGRAGRAVCAIQSVGVVVGTGNERTTTIEAVTVGAVEDVQYG